MISKKLILKVFAISTFIALVMAAYVYVNRNQSQVSLTPSGIRSRFLVSSPTPTPFVEIPSFTGAVDTTPKPLTPRETQFSNLVNKTPFNLGFAAVDMDYANNKFKVVLVAPYLESKTNFMTWLKDNGFGLITKSDIEFSEK
jgi:hypothetical protein